jgi:hypothetical protein
MRTIAMAAVLLAMSTVAGAAEVVKKVHPAGSVAKVPPQEKFTVPHRGRTTSRCA